MSADLSRQAIELLREHAAGEHREPRADCPACWQHEHERERAARVASLPAEAYSDG